MSECAKFLDSFLIISNSGFNRSREKTQITNLAVDADSCSPAVALRLFKYTLKSGLVISIGLLVAAIFCDCSNPQILPAIIQAIIISMVYFIVWTCIHNETMQFNGGSLSIAKRNIPPSIERSRIFSGIPFPLIKPIEISFIHNGKLSLG